MCKKKYFFCILGVLRVLVSYEKTQPGYQLIQYITHMIVIVYYHYYFFNVFRNILCKQNTQQHLIFT